MQTTLDSSPHPTLKNIPLSTTSVRYFRQFTSVKADAKQKVPTDAPFLTGMVSDLT